MIEVQKPGMTFAKQTVATGTSRDWKTSAGNRWGVDFVGTSIADSDRDERRGFRGLRVPGKQAVGLSRSGGLRRGLAHGRGSSPTAPVGIAGSSIEQRARTPWTWTSPTHPVHLVHFVHAVHSVHQRLESARPADLRRSRHCISEPDRLEFCVCELVEVMQSPSHASLDVTRRSGGGGSRLPVMQ